MDQKNEWDNHWKKLKENSSLFGKILESYRKLIIANAVRYYFEKYFPRRGTFVEMGSGTSQTSTKIMKYNRTLIALDISKSALEQAIQIPQIDKTLQGNILHTDLKPNSVDGIWNLGVMEHFSEEDITRILDEFSRVMKPGSYAILFWPPTFGSSELILGTLESTINLFKKTKFHFFPCEITRLKSRAHAQKIIAQSKLQFINAHFNLLDGFTHLVVICKKE